MKNIRIVSVAALVILALILVKVFFFSSEKAKSAAAPKGKAAPSNVVVTVVAPGKFDNRIYVTGTVLANEEAVLRPEVPGRITQLLFREGSAVSKGELLLKISDADLQAQLKKLASQVKLAEEKEARQKKLLEIKGVSQEEYDASLTQLDNLRAEQEYTRAMIAKTEIRAPFNGTVGLKKVSEGSYVSAGMDIASVQQTNPVKIDFFIPEKYTSQVHTNDKIYFSLQGQDKKYTASVYAVEPRIDMATRTMQVRALCRNPGTIVPGAFARIELVLQSSDTTIMIPSEALIPELKGQKVFLYKGGSSEPQKVITGVRTDTQVEITSGLKAGDTLIVSGIMQLKPGAPVRISSVKNTP